MSYNSKYTGQQVEEAIEKVYNNDFYYYCGKDNTFDLDNLPYSDIYPSDIMTSLINTYSLPNNQIGKLRYMKDAKGRNIILIQSKEDPGSANAICQAIDGSNVYFLDIYVYAVDTPHLSCKKVNYINIGNLTSSGGDDVVVMTATDTAGPPSEYADVVEIHFQQGNLELFNKLISNKKYSHIIVNGMTCFGELNDKLLVLMGDNISSIYHKDINLYSGDTYLIWGSWSKPVIPLVKKE